MLRSLQQRQALAGAAAGTASPGVIGTSCMAPGRSRQMDGAAQWLLLDGTAHWLIRADYLRVTKPAVLPEGRLPAYDTVP